MYQERGICVVERRRKRMIVPIIYFMAEIIVAWLMLVLIQLNFNIIEWSVWSILFFMMVIGYSALKTIHVYRRQRNYPENSDDMSLKI